jgi:hypothetical protein
MTWGSSWSQANYACGAARNNYDVCTSCIIENQTTAAMATSARPTPNKTKPTHVFDKCLGPTRKCHLYLYMYIQINRYIYTCIYTCIDIHMHKVYPIIYEYSCLLYTSSTCCNFVGTMIHGKNCKMFSCRLSYDLMVYYRGRLTAQFGFKMHQLMHFKQLLHSRTITTARQKQCIHLDSLLLRLRHTNLNLNNTCLNARHHILHIHVAYLILHI